MADISQDRAIEVMMEGLMDNLDCAEIKLPEDVAREVLERKFEEALEEKDDQYDPSNEDNQCIIDDAIELMIERFGLDAWHEALREARESRLGSNVGWLYENMSQEIVADAFEELKNKI